MNTQHELAWFTQQLLLHADANRAAGEKKYMKSPLKYYGVTTPTKRKLVKTWLKEHKTTTIDEVALLADKLWDSPYSEGRDLAVQLLQYRMSELTFSQLHLIEKMINQSVSWGHLDEIAKWLVGGLIDNDPRTLRYLLKWSRSPNFWVRRAALLGQLIQFRRRAGDKELFFRLAIKEFHEEKSWSKEERFFIRKAIGWVLREIAEKEPDLTYHFVKRYKNQMSGLTYREATRKLPLSLKTKLQ